MHEDFLCDKLFDWAFGDYEDNLDEALLQASAEFESKIMPCATAPARLRLHLQQTPPTATKPTFYY